LNYRKENYSNPISEANAMTAIAHLINLDLSKQIIDDIGQPVENFVPFAFHNVEGDCIEFFISNEMYYGERIDDYVTVYRNVETNDITGAVIKNVKRLCRELSA
jgi:hypothetical protein